MMGPEFSPPETEIGEKEKQKPIDALVVFGFGITSDQDLEKMAMGSKIVGHPEKGWRLSIGARLRVLGATELYAAGEVNDVILTGGPVAQGAGIEASEAQLMKKYFLHELKKKWQRELKNQGKTDEEIQGELADRMQDAESHILLEDKATNTIENFAHTINFLETNKEKYRDIGLLSNDFHIDRIIQLASKMDVEGKGFGADKVLQEADIDPRLKTIDQRYFGRENDVYREQVLTGLDEENRPIAEARLGTSLKDYERGERRWSRGLGRIPEYWLPNVKFIEDFGKLKRILKAEEAVQQVLGGKGVEDIDLATEKEIRQALDQVARKMPPEEWGENRPQITIDLVRHGQSHHNMAEPAYFAGGSKEYDTGLTDKGIQTAKNQAEQIKKGGKVDVIVYTDLMRSRETAEVIASELDYPVDLVEITGFREVDVGELAGKTREEVRTNGSEAAKIALENFVSGDISKINFPGGEHYEQVCQRVKASLERIIRDYGDKAKIVIVGHGNSNKVALSLMFPEEFNSIKGLDSHEAVIEFDMAANRSANKPENLRVLNQSENGQGLI